jgi:hypothetical protein
MWKVGSTQSLTKKCCLISQIKLSQICELKYAKSVRLFPNGDFQKKLVWEKKLDKNVLEIDPRGGQTNFACGPNFNFKMSCDSRNYAGLSHSR